MVAIAEQTRSSNLGADARKIIREDLAHEIRKARKCRAIALRHGWTATAGALQHYIEACRRSGRYYHR